MSVFLALGFALLPVPTHCSPGNVPNPTPGPLMSTPLINTGQPTLYTVYTYVFISVGRGCYHNSDQLINPPGYQDS